MSNPTVIIADLETYFEIFLCVCYDPQEDKWYRFAVSKWKNDLDKLVKYIESHEDHYFVFYNGLRFDTQVLEFIIRNYENWNEKGNLEICAIISQLAADTIDNSNYNIFPNYREVELSFKTIDPFEVAHYSNKNRIVSLKRLEFEMDMENLEETPIDFQKKDITKEDCILVIHYCENDVKALYEFYKVLIGETEHPLYKGNNQIQLRQDIEIEFGIPCLNYSDSKIGDEMIKKFYCQEKQISYSDLPKKGTFRPVILVKQCIAPYVVFKTPQMKEFHKQIRGRSMTMKDEFLEEIKFYGQTYTFARGGLHTVNTPKIFEATEDLFIIDWDVSSYYPAIIINNNKYPGHLGKEFLKGYKKMFERRLELKPLAKTDKRIAGIVGALKLAVNSVYGKSSDMSSWMFDRLLTMFTTITGELSLMMLIEAYELAGIPVISCNTDGITVMIPKDKIDKMTEINSWWMNLTQYELERTDYSKIIFSTVNDYLAIKTNGEIKRKGDFLVDFELHKNKSARVVPIALSNYFVHGISISDSIVNHSNVFDFAMRQKASKDFHYEGHNRETGKISVYNKLIRYYISWKGEKILKIKNAECTTNAVAVSQVDAGDWVATVCNHLTKDHPMDNINRNYYIDRANRIVMKILYEGRKHKVESSNQLTLF